MVARCLLAWCLVGLVIAPVRSQESSPFAAKLQEKLDALFKQGGMPGVSAAVALKDGTILPLVAGWADREAKKAMTPQDLLIQGSVGKTYVAAVSLQLVQEKKLALDDRIEKHLGQEVWFAKMPNGRDITVRMLMNHTSGLVRYEFQQKFTDDLTRQPEKSWKPEELLSYILGSKAPFPAGTKWEYSDTNYIVLGMVIEQVTGNSFHTELRRRLLEPLGLRQTVAVTGRRVPGLIPGYAGPRNPFGGKDRMLDERGEMIINPQFEWTGGGMASTPGDLARWAKFLYEGKAFDPALMPTMLDGVAAPMLGREAKYGLGVILKPSPYGPTYGHSGFFPGYLTEVMYWPEHRVAVVVQTNTSDLRTARPPLSRWCVELAGVILQGGAE